MVARGAHSWHEITTQGQSWGSALDETLARADALRPLLAANRDRRTFFIGCGSTHYLALYAAPTFQRITGRSARGVPSSELRWQTDTLLTPGEVPLVVALSRSGATSETILAVEHLSLRADALTISCYDDTPLARASTLTIAIPGGREESYAQTRSFAGMLVAAQTLAALSARDDALLAELRQLPALAEDVIARADALARQIGPNEGFKRITYLGSGALYGLASEATVKMKEMSLSLAEPYHFMEFRHGPMALVDEAHLIVALLSDEMRAYETAVLRDLKARGATIVAVGSQVEDVADFADATLALGAPVGPVARGVLYLPFLQLLAYHRAMGRGLNPDRPRHVVMSIQLDGTDMR
ncbi:MAG: SIS domain-containing protein [Chloroflexota bacterium]